MSRPKEDAKRQRQQITTVVKNIENFANNINKGRYRIVEYEFYSVM
jgi:hypothetical protein